jgi:integrase
LPGFHAGQAPGNKGLRYPADPPKVEEIVAVMRAAGDRPHGRRLRGLIGIVWRSGLRIQEALALAEVTSINAAARSWSDGARAVAVARLGWTHGAANNSTPGSACAVSTDRAAVLRHQWHDARAPLVDRHAVETAREGVPLIVIQRELGHSNPRITSVYLQGIDSGEIIETVHARRAPMVPASVSLRL